MLSTKADPAARPVRTRWAAAPVMLLAISVLAAQSPPAAQPPEPFIKENATVKLAGHTYVIPDMNVGLVPNVGIVVGSRAALVIDTGLGPKNGEAVMREVRKVSSHAELYLVTTHFHPEHDLGASAFPPTTKMIRARAQQQDVGEFDLQLARAFSKRSPTIASLLEGAAYRKADVLFDREYSLDLGGVHVQLLAVGPTHTRGDTAAFVQQDRVLFAGDVAMPALPAFASPYSSIKAWRAALDQLSKLGATRIVPSHGDIGDARLIGDYRAYFETLQRRARELKAKGVDVDAAVETISKELQPAYEKRQPSRIAAAARVAYSEAP